MKEQYKKMFNFVAIIVLLVSQTAVFSITWYGYFTKIESHTFSAFYQKGNWAVIGVYMLLMFLFTQMLGGYKVGYQKNVDTCISHIIAILCCNVIEYFQLCIIFHAYISVLPVLSMAFIEILIVIPWVLLTRQLYLRIYPAKHIVYVYGKHFQRELVKKINQRDDKYSIEAAISISKGLAVIYEKISDYEAVIIGDIPAQTRNDILKYCYEKNIRTYVVPKLSDLILMGTTEINLFDTPLLLARNYGLSAEQLFVKRIMDILISACGLIILSPFMLLTALAIKVYDGGSIFYTQERLTRDRKVFKIIKFRSMRTAKKDDKEYITMQGDNRITPIGKIIRRIHFDEIPQLINILKGDMSFIGPRPEWKMCVEEYEQAVPEFAFRLKVKAGLTGYAQVYGKYNTTPYDKLRLDLMYIENYSLWLDIKIILLTVKTLFRKETTEGIAEGQVTAMIAASEETESDV